ncbi:MAG: HEAT repeat domain-containing protein [Thermoguttaceae bacterium]
MAKILIVLYTVGIAAAAVIAVGEIESILCSGPALAITGVLIALISFRAERPIGFYYGLSAPTMTVVCFCVIFGLNWGPDTAHLPIAASLAVFSLACLPSGVFAVLETGRKSARHSLRFQFGIAALLWAMLIVALFFSALRMDSASGAAIVIAAAYGAIMRSCVKRYRRLGHSGALAASSALDRVAIVLISGSLLFVVGLLCLRAAKQAGHRSEAAERMAIAKSADPDYRTAAANALGELGSAGVPALTELLGDKDAGVRQAAVESLGKIGPEAKTAIPTLVNLLRDGHSGLPDSASKSLAKIGPAAIPALKDFLSDSSKDKWVRRRAASTLGQIGAATVPALRELSNDKSVEFRCAVVDALEQASSTGAGAKAAVPVLARLLTDPDLNVRNTAARAVSRIGPKAEPAIPALVTLLRHRDTYPMVFGDEAAVALGKIGPAAIPAIMELLKDKDVQCRWAAVSALKEVGSAAVPVLVRSLKNKSLNSDEVFAVEMALGRIGSPAVSTLVECLNNPAAYVRCRAASALREAGPPKSAIPALSKMLREREERTQYAAAMALVRLGKAAIPALLDVLKERSAGAWYAADALGKIGPEARTAVPILTELLRDKNRRIRLSAASALADIDPKAEVTMPVLVELLADGDQGVRSCAAEATGKFGPMARTATPALIGLLTDRDADVRCSAAGALGKIGPEAKTATPALNRLLHDEDEHVRDAAAESLRAIKEGKK